MKKSISVLLILIFVLHLLSSCVTAPDFNNSFVGNEPEPVSLPRKGSACSFSANVYSVSENAFRSNRIMIETYNNISPINALISTLLSQKSISYLANKLSVETVLISSDICILNLTGKAPSDESDYLTLEALIINTLHDFCSCNALCMLINGQMPTLKGMPYGTATYLAHATPEEYISQRTEVLSSKDKSSFSGSEALFFLLYDNSDLVYPRMVSERIFKFSDNRLQHAQNLISVYSDAYTKYINRTQQADYDKCFSADIVSSDNNSYNINVELTGEYYAENDQLIKAIGLTLICNMNDVKNVKISLGNSRLSVKPDELFDYVGTPFDFYYPLRNVSTL